MSTSLHVRAKFQPWPRTLVQLAGWSSAALLWWAGTRDGDPHTWPLDVVWVPLAGLVWINIRWHREADAEESLRSH